MSETPGLKDRFESHIGRPGDGRAERYRLVREYGLGLAEVVDIRCPDSREKSLALTKIEEAVFWANAAIARHEHG